MGEARCAIALIAASAPIALALYVAILAAKYALARHYAATHPETETTTNEGTNDVTIVQPILGGDPFLAEALQRNLANPDGRFLWLVDENDAEGRRVTEPLAATSRDRVTILLCPPASPDTNPKTAKLQLALAAIATPYFAVLDDDTILTPHHVRRAIAALQSATLYTGLPCYLRGANVWSSLVTHFVNNNSITTYLALLPFAPPLSINGMFYVMRTQDLRDAGGFAPIVDQLCDDYALATLIRERGGTIRQGITPQFLHTTVVDGGHYLRLMHRWFVFANRLVADQPFARQLLLFVLLGLPPLLLWIALPLLAFTTPSIAASMLLTTLLLRHLLLRDLHRRVFGTLPHFHWLMSIVAELLQPLHWLHATLQRTIRWRTRRVRLGRNGTFVTAGEPR